MPEAVILETRFDNQSSTDRLVFRHLPAYASYIGAHFLIPYVEEQIRIAREIDLPLLNFFVGLTDLQIVEMSIESSRAFLKSAQENKLREKLELSLQRWVTDQLRVLKRNEITANDILMTGYLRKSALLKFLPAYTTDVETAILIVNEIDTLTVESDLMATNIYIQLLKDRIEEQALFTEALSNTTPGIHYIFSLSGSKVKYANTNAARYFGFSPDELSTMGSAVIANVVYPDDVAATIDNLNKCTLVEDGEVVAWEVRLRDANGKYNWMRNYSSVYKRDAQGIPVEIVGIALDVNVEKDIADKLLFRERQLLDAQDQAKLGSFVLDVETGLMDVTPQFREIYELDEFDIYTLIDHVHPADRARVNENRNRAISENGLYDNEYRYLINGREKVLWTRGGISYRNGRKVMTGTAMDVTNRHKMMQELLESRDLYRQAQQLSHIGNWNCDLKTNKYTWSDELYRIYEVEPQQGFVDAAITFKYLHPEDVGIVRGETRKLMELHRPCDFSFRIILPDGRLKYLHVKGGVSFDESGIATHMFGTTQDITERQSLIEQLKESDKLFRQAQAIGHIGNWVWDMESKRLDWSDEIYHIYELQPQSLSDSESLFQYNHPDDNALISEFIKRAVETLTPFDFNYRILLKSGMMKILNARGEVEVANNGAYRIYGTLQDITRQKTIEKQLKEYKEFIEKITDVTPSIIAAYNVHTGVVSFINEAVEKLLGYPSRQIMEQGVAFLVSITHPDDLAAIMEQNAGALDAANRLLPGAGEPIVEFKYRMLHKNGSYRWIHTYGTIFERNEAGLVESVLNISIDVTTQELAEQALFQKNRQLQQSNTSLEEYAYVASHDLKDPLRKIATFSDRLLTTHASVLTDDGRLFLNKILDSSARMQKMINDLLTVSTIAGNRAFAPVDLNIVLAEAVQALDHKIEEVNAVIEADNLPEVTVVSAQFRQLFQNLLNNSLKFVRSGVPAVIKISRSYPAVSRIEEYGLIRTGKYLQIDLADNGIGFDDQYAGRIFGLFQRLHGSSSYEGTGIGLAVCKKIVENHGGVIFAHGVVGNGAVFSIIIPV